ncbi:MAG TPA: maleylacetoacetate isomerase [Rudaea sp.]|jgi:maleylacetoacetate isomerase|nr:maleylacetoacetate isomerase [Rudaea sp.]
MAGERIKLYSYWRSSAAYRVRIALNLKGLPYELIPVHLINNGGEHHSEAYQEINPQQKVPTLIDGERIIRQSMAIVEYIEETYDGEHRLMPVMARERARVRALAQIVACDIHPVNNLSVMQYLEHEFNTPQVERDRWTRHWITEGFKGLEKLLATNPSTGQFCEGDEPSLADICLIPQVYNAYRWSVDMDQFPLIRKISDECMKMEAFDRAKPENQPDAPKA